MLDFDEVSPNAMAVFQEDASEVQEALLPRVRDTEILVQVEAMIEDPQHEDWEQVDTVTQEYNHTTRGVDFSGTVVKRGSSVACGVSAGDHVVGFIRSNSMHRAMQSDPRTRRKYAKIEAELAWVVPKGTFSHEGAAKARLGRFRYIFGVQDP